MNYIKKYSDIWIWPAIVFALHVLVNYFGIYDKYLWMDSPLHFMGGITITLSMYFYLRHDRQTQTSFITFFVLLVGSTAIAAVVWEFIEFALDYTLHSHHQPGLADTMKDLFIGLSASIITSVIIYSKTKARK